MSGRLRWSLGVAALGLLVVGGWVLGRPDNEHEGRWVRLARRDLVLEVEVAGELVSEESLTLGPPAVSQIYNFKISFMVPEGSDVQQGMPVLGFDTTELQQRLQQVAAERDTAQKNLEKRRTDLEIERRGETLALAEAQARLRRAELKTSVPQRVVASKDLETARIDQDLAEIEIRHRQERLEHLDRSSQGELAGLAAERDRAALRVEEIERQIAAMQVAAPRSGTVIYEADWRGEKKKVGDSVWRARKVLSIPNLERMRADGEVVEARAGHLRPGQVVRLTLDAFPDEELRGVVREIHKTVQERSWRDPRKVVRLEIALGEDYSEVDPERMRPGMRFHGTIEIDRIENALALPLAAVIPGADAAVEVRSRFGKLVERRVEPVFGVRNEEWVEVLAGLEEGDRVWLDAGGG